MSTPDTHPRTHLRTLTLTFVLLSLLGGCATSTSENGWAEQTPRTRLGALPFPGLLNLYESSGINDLGPHHYRGWNNRPFEPLEGARGIMYTRQAGFIDVSHLRESVDWTRFISFHAREVLVAGGGTFSFEHEGTTYQLRLTLPEAYAVSSSVTSEDELDEAAIRIGQRVAYSRAVWHEIMTWNGWNSMIGVSERRSAFTWDDLTSDLLGTIIGGQAVREHPADYDQCAERLIRETLSALDPVPADEVRSAAYAVENHWWKNEMPIRRDLDAGLESGSKHPWLVPTLSGSSISEAHAIPLPTLHDIAGIDWSGHVEILITPPSRYREKIAPGTTVHSGPLNAHRDFATIIDHIRMQMESEWGPGCTKPGQMSAPPTTAAAR